MLSRKNRLISITFFASFLLIGAFMVAMPRTALAAHCNPVTEQALAVAIPDPANPGLMIHCVPKSSATVATNPIIGYLRVILQFMVVGIGIALVGGLTVGGIVIMTARANAQQVQKGEEIIRNAIIGIALYVFTFAIVNFLIPGGILV